MSIRYSRLLRNGTSKVINITSYSKNIGEHVPPGPRAPLRALEIGTLPEKNCTLPSTDKESALVCDIEGRVRFRAKCWLWPCMERVCLFFLNSSFSVVSPGAVIQFRYIDSVRNTRNYFVSVVLLVIATGRV